MLINFSSKWLPLFLGLALLLVSCEKEEARNTEPAKKEAIATPPLPKIFWSDVKLHGAIRAKNPDYTGQGQFKIDEGGNPIAIGLDNCNITDISALQGMKLQGLYLQACPIEDISVLKGMPLVELALEKTKVKDLSPLSGNKTLQKLYLGGSGVEDLSPLKGAPISELNLVDTHIKKLDGVAGMPIKMLWLTGSPVEDITSLRSCPELVSLTLHKTNVKDLSPLSGTRLQRLHIAETPVTDLSPLTGMALTRLVFTKERITKGLEAIQTMPSLRELGSKFDDEGKDLVHPSAYWSKQN